METVNDRMEILVNELCNGNKALFAKSIGLQPTAISSYLGSKRRSKPSIDMVTNISNNLNVDLDWLLTGKGPMLKQSDHAQLPEARRTEARGKGIPLIPLDAVAGFPAIDNDGVSYEDCERYSIPEFEAKGANFLIRVSGDSMTPMYNNGDIIACRKIADILFFQWGAVYVLDTSQGVLVKYVEECEKDGDSIVCVSENKRYKPFRLPKEDIRSLSTIVGLVRLV